MTSNGTTFIPSFMSIGSLIQNLKGDTQRHILPLRNEMRQKQFLPVTLYDWKMCYLTRRETHHLWELRIKLPIPRLQRGYISREREILHNFIDTDHQDINVVIQEIYGGFYVVQVTETVKVYRT
jgi:hypothetical protein